MKVSSIDAKRGIRQQQSGSGLGHGTIPAGSVDLLAIDVGTRMQLMGVDAIVGSALNVAQGHATHSTLQAAIDATNAGGRIRLLPGTYAGATTFTTSNRVFEGSGYTTNISGSLTLTNASFNIFRSIRFTGSVSVSAGSNGNIFAQGFVATSATIIDAGSGTAIDMVSEA